MDRSEIKQAVILAGGLGTRMAPFTDTNPKPMYPFSGKPFIEYLIEQAVEFGIDKILILLGYLPNKIMEYLGDGSRYGVEIIYDITPVEFNTGERIYHARDVIDDNFLFLYCDNYCPIHYAKLVRDYFDNQAWIQVSVYENRDAYTKSNLLIEEDGHIAVYDKKRVTAGLQGVDIGYAIINKKVFDYISNEETNFEAAVYPKVINNKRMFATVTKHRYYSVGSWERINLTEQFFKNQPTVFLDRDGTINVKAAKACYIESPEQFQWLSGAKEAIKLLNSNGYRVILVSNQPGIARGNLTEEILSAIHQKMQRELEEAGGKIDHIYYCPHNWDDGCECRKPKPGMLYQAQKDFSLNLTKCIMIGDDDRDMEAGMAAGCKCIQVTEAYGILQAVEDLINIRCESGKEE